MTCNAGMLEIAIWGVSPFCVSQTGTVVAAVVAALASLVVAISRLAFDGGERTKREEFEASQQATRLAFEQDQRIKREAYERAQVERQAQSERARDRANDTRQSQLKLDLQDYITKQSWLNLRHEEWLKLVKDASDSLDLTMDGVARLLNLGPAYDDMTMISETATVLGLYGAFKKQATYSRMPHKLREGGAELANDLAKLFLTLSPVQSVRGSEQRKSQLAELSAGLDEKVKSFHALCRRFERDPGQFE